ncbi:MAG: hypothetical protein QXX95_08165 [Nitrososphaerales archaeon]
MVEEREVEIEITKQDIPYILIIQIIFLSLFFLLPSNFSTVKLILGIFAILFIPGYAIAHLLIKHKIKILQFISMANVTGFLYLSYLFLILKIFNSPNILIPILALITTLTFYLREAYTFSLPKQKELLPFVFFIIFLSLFIPITFLNQNISIPYGHMEPLSLSKSLNNFMDPFISSFSSLLYLSGNDEMLASLAYSTLTYILFFSSIYLFLSEFFSKTVLNLASIILVLLLPSFTSLAGVGFNKLLVLLSILAVFSYLLTKNEKREFAFTLFFGASVILIDDLYGIFAILTLSFFTLFQRFEKTNINRKRLIGYYLILTLMIPFFIKYNFQFGQSIDKILLSTVNESLNPLAIALIASLASVALLIFLKKEKLGIFLSWLIASILLTLFFKIFFIPLIFILALASGISLLKIFERLNIKKLSKFSYGTLSLFLILLSYSILGGFYTFNSSAEDSSKDLQSYLKDAKALMKRIEREIALERIIIAPNGVNKVLALFVNNEIFGRSNVVSSDLALKMLYSNYEVLGGGLRIREQMPYSAHFAPSLGVAINNEYKEVLLIDDYDNYLFLKNNSQIKIAQLENTKVGLRESEAFVGIRYDYFSSWLKIRKQEEIRDYKLSLTYLVIDYSEEKLLDALEIRLFFLKGRNSLIQAYYEIKNISMVSKSSLALNLKDRNLFLEFGGDFKEYYIRDDAIILIFKRHRDKDSLLAKVEFKLEASQDVKEVKVIKAEEVIKQYLSQGNVYIVIPKEELWIKRFLGEQFVKLYEGEKLVGFLVRSEKLE